jgi:hypothetical protein
MTYKGYKYQTEQEAQQARQQAADYYGLPVTPESTTIYFVNYNYSELDEFYYIVWVEGCTEVLGEPINFEITEPDINLN